MVRSLNGRLLGTVSKKDLNHKLGKMQLKSEAVMDGTQRSDLWGSKRVTLYSIGQLRLSAWTQ